MRVAVLLT